MVLETTNLTKQFGGLTAVDHVDFTLEEGELRCIIGPNGAGKSTFLKLLTGFHTPNTGSIIFNGDEITNLDPYLRARRGISLKFQQLSVYRELTVEQNLRIPIQRKTHREIDARIAELLAVTGLEDKRTMNVKDLSHGEQQWLEIAMSIAIDPSLLLLDEPTAGMTIEETRETGDMIMDLVSDGLTVLLIEHDVNFVQNVADFVTVLHNGKIFTEDTVDEVVTHAGVQEIYLGKDHGGD